MGTSGRGKHPGSHIQPLSCRCDPARVNPWWYHQSGQRTFPYGLKSPIRWWIRCCQEHSNPVLQKHMSSYSLYTIGKSYLCYLLTHSMVQSPSWAANWFAAGQEIPRFSRNPKVHYRTHKRPPPVSIPPNTIRVTKPRKGIGWTRGRLEGLRRGFGGGTWRKGVTLNT